MMNTRMLLSLGLSALVMGGTMVGCTTTGRSVAGVGTRAVPGAGQGKEAKLAGKALGRRDAVSAVSYAEAAVAAAPGRGDYRVLLGQGYLQAGRFRSAREAFADALRLMPDDGKAALNFALTQIATGDWQAARTTLAVHRGQIAASDRGLALALAGDPAGAVAMLTAAAREPGADAKVRQNLGLALALAGQWPMARAVAAADLSPADVDGRMQQWAAFAQPAHASDQVAALLGVTSAEDHGQPVALALVAPVSTGGATQIVPAAAAVVAPVAAVEPVLSPATIVTGPRQAIVQPLPVSATAAFLGPAATTVALPAAAPVAGGPGKGEWFVQLGAFSQASGAHDAWGRVTRHYAGFGGHQPQGTFVRVKAGTLYRLSVGGFDRAGADALCTRYRAQGGACFVRREAGDRIAQWLRRPGMQLAMR